MSAVIALLASGTDPSLFPLTCRTSRHKIGPQNDCRSDSNGSRLDMINRMACLGANVYHQ